MITKEELAEWTLYYIKSRDAIKREIQAVEEGKDGFDLVFIKKDRKHYVCVLPAVNDLSGLYPKLTTKDQFTVVVLNTRTNLNFLKKNWKELCEHPTLNLIFVNPNSTTDIRWVIAPHVHNRITDPKSLSKGLDAIFEGVDEVH